jgi:superfamily II DNA/RNA helicase
MDFMQQGVVKLDSINFFVLDEVDRMLDMGFVRDIKKIRSQMKNIQQTYTFSATISTEIKKIIDEQIRDHIFVKVGDVVTVDKIHHSYIPVEHEYKIANVRQLIDNHTKDKIIIFTQTKRNTKSISTALSRHYRVGMLNGDMSQGKRNTTLASFKSGDIRILVTTDVAAR